MESVSKGYQDIGVRYREYLRASLQFLDVSFR